MIKKFKIFEQLNIDNNILTKLEQDFQDVIDLPEVHTDIDGDDSEFTITITMTRETKDQVADIFRFSF